MRSGEEGERERNDPIKPAVSKTRRSALPLFFVDRREQLIPTRANG